MKFLGSIHPGIVHFPIVLFIFYFIFESGGILLKKEFLSKASYIILVAGLLAAIAAVLTGNQAQELVKQFIKTNTGEYLSLIERHEQYATFVLWYFFSVLIFRTYLLVKKKFTGYIRFVFIVLGLFGSFLIFKAGSLGGELVFRYGIGTQLLGK